MPVTEEIRGHARVNLDKMTQQSLIMDAHAHDGYISDEYHVVASAK